MNITDKDFDFNESYDSVHNQSGMASRAMQNIVSVFDDINDDIRMTDEEKIIASDGLRVVSFDSPVTIRISAA